MKDNRTITLTNSMPNNLVLRDPAKTWILIIGAGASCAEFISRCVKRQIANDDRSIGYIIVDPRSPDQDGRGIAWTSSQSSGHFANMHLDTMGQTIPNLTEEFRTIKSSNSEDIRLFRRRVEIGDYLHEKFLQILSAANEFGIIVDRIQQKAIDLEKYERGYKVKLIKEDGEDAGEWAYADKIVFALGHLPATSYRHLKGSDRYISNPWNWAEIEALPKDLTTVGLLGMGPTAVDVVTVLRDSGFDGKIESFSRTGLMQYPRPRYNAYQRKVFTEENVRALFKHFGPLSLDHISSLITAELTASGCSITDFESAVERVKLPARKALALGIYDSAEFAPWFSVLKSFDDVTAITWHCLSATAKAEYIAKWRKYHTAISYGMITLQAAKLTSEVINGTLSVHSNIGQVEAIKNGFRVHYSLGGQMADKTVDALINCTGIGTEVKESSSPLIKNLLKRKVFIPHGHGGVMTNFETGQIVTHDNVAFGELYTLVGSLNYGTRLLTHCYGEVEKSAQRLAELIFPSTS